MSKAVLIVGYGTRTGNLTEILERQAARLRARGRQNVYVTYFRVSSPSIEEVMERIADDGMDDVLALPYCVSEGRLTAELVPERMGIGNASHGIAVIKGRKVHICIAPAFNDADALTNILCDRIADAGGSMDSGVLVVGHGSKDANDSNRNIVGYHAKRLCEIGYKNVEVGFNEFVEPSIEEGLSRLVAKGATEVIVTPLFIACGVHLGEEIAEKLKIPKYSKGGEIEVDGKKICVKYMAPIEDDSRILELLDSRIADYYGE